MYRRWLVVAQKAGPQPLRRGLDVDLGLGAQRARQGEKDGAAGKEGLGKGDLHLGITSRNEKKGVAIFSSSPAGPRPA